MGRVHLFEFNDQPWLPDVLRDGMTGYLETISDRFKMHEVMVPIVAEALEASGAAQIIDLCSGGTGPVLRIRDALPEPVPVVLTDKYPNLDRFRAAMAPGVTPRFEPVDATAVPDDLRGLRTIFNAFHHFKPQDARAILEDAWSQDAPIVIVEVTERRAATLLTSPLILLGVCLMMPLVRPARLAYWLLTYLLPIFPALIWWDGVVSHLRAYAPDELRALTQGLDKPGYVWTIRHVPLAPGSRITVLTGLPTREGAP